MEKDGIVLHAFEYVEALAVMLILSFNIQFIVQPHDAFEQKSDVVMKSKISDVVLRMDRHRWWELMIVKLMNIWLRRKVNSFEIEVIADAKKEEIHQDFSCGMEFPDPPTNKKE
ncbi:hypothetical protein VNO80_14015 [Phaseolus coccineus]|uniref:Uncharacterized protein n=1 Tax=Phaseolus coccineus TaxID=3886 RepID=A0AAN9N8D0_PHACN